MAVLRRRLERLQAELRGRDIQCLALIPGANLRYMTGLAFHLMERPSIGFFPAEGLPAFVLPRLEAPRFEAAAPYEAQVFAWADEEGPEKALRDAMMALPEVHTLAVEFLRMRVLEFKLVQRHVPNALVVDAAPVMDALRLFKDEAEVALMREAIRITEQALRAVVEEVRPGMTERTVANRLAIALLEAGGGPVPFEPIVLSGPNAAQPHGVPGDRELRAGEVLLIDFGTSRSGYVSDITRTFQIAEPPSPRTQEIYEVVRAANEAGRAAAGPGVPCQEVDRAARRVIEEAGFGEYFVHRTGHGIGLDAHERPYIVEGDETPLEPGMTFTVEPGIYIPGEIGVRIEDDMLITPQGAESLTTFPRDLIVVSTAGG